MILPELIPKEKNFSCADPIEWNVFVLRILYSFVGGL
jgi:hypothetical protein